MTRVPGDGAGADSRGAAALGSAGGALVAAAAVGGAAGVAVVVFGCVAEELVVALPPGDVVAALPAADLDVAGEFCATTAAELADPRGQNDHVAASAANPTITIAATTTIAAVCDCCKGCAGE